MSQSDTNFVSVLQAAGFSLTRQRRTVFNLLQHNDAVTMHDLVGQAAATMDRASVYRTVALFEKLGIAHRITIGWKYKIELSDAFSEHHHHLTCLNCHRVTAVHVDAIEDLVAQLANRHSFELQAHQIEIQGYCAKCRS